MLCNETFLILSALHDPSKPVCRKLNLLKSYIDALYSFGGSDVCLCHTYETESFLKKSGTEVFNRFRPGDVEAVCELQSEQEYTCNNHYEMLDADGKALYDQRGIYPTNSRYYANGHLKLTRSGEVLVDAGGRMHYEVESLYANYILDASDREAALGTDPAEASRQMRSSILPWESSAERLYSWWMAPPLPPRWALLLSTEISRDKCMAKARLMCRPENFKKLGIPI